MANRLFDLVVRAGNRTFLCVVAVAALAAYVTIYACHLADTPARSDGYSYDVYLPSWVICQDGSLETLSNRCCGGVFPAWNRWRPTGASHGFCR
jgi:hypothetical protein